LAGPSFSVGTVINCCGLLSIERLGASTLYYARNRMELLLRLLLQVLLLDNNCNILKMADDDVIDRCFTKFMLATYTPTRDYLKFLSLAVRGFGFLRSLDENAEMFHSGSTAEFHINPMLSCIGDIDVMLIEHRYLAIPQGHTPPKELPSQYQCEVDVLEIVDSHQPGYVHLRHSYVLRKNDNGCYVAVKRENSENKFLGRLMRPIPQTAMEDLLRTNQKLQILTKSMPNLRTYRPTIALHGPAIDVCINSSHLLDYVPCIRCLLWPPQANDWPTRNRDYGWPHQTTINTVVDNGCDVVQAVHPSSRQDEWMSKYQCRLSFSRAEVTLLNSWTPVQQVVYHTLRFVIKREILTEEYDEDPNLPKLSNYHIKTLMLWECEQKPQSWWSESSVIKLCSSLLHKLSDCVAAKCCQHYFINNCNLLDYFMDYDNDVALMLCGRLKSLANEKRLLNWFVDSYISKCAQECTDSEVTALFEDVCSCDKLKRAVQALTDWKLNFSPQLELLRERYWYEKMALNLAILCRGNALWAQMIMRELQNFGMQLHECYVAVKCLWVAHAISTNSLTEDSLELMWTLFDPSAATIGDVKTTELKTTAISCVKKTSKLASLRSIGSNALQVLYNEMSKAYLHHCFAHGQESTYCVIHILLAVLYYKSGHYQAAIDHCKQVLNQTACEQYGLRCIGAEYLPQIDENVDAVSGLILLYQHVQEEALNSAVYHQQRTELAFNVELFAHYLYLQCTNVASSNHNKLTKYRQRLCNTKRPLLCDVLLFKQMKVHHSECTEVRPNAGGIGTDDENTGSHSMDTSLLVTSLELVALEKLTTYRQMMVRELHSEQIPFMNEFEALYAYKRGLFEECLQMCRKHVNTLLDKNVSGQFYYVVAPEFVSLFDGELSSIFGVIRLLCPSLVFLQSEYPEFNLISALTLSVYLMAQCEKKIRKHSVIETLSLIRYVHDDSFSGNKIKTLLDRLILAVTYRSLKLYVDDLVCSVYLELP